MHLSVEKHGGLVLFPFVVVFLVVYLILTFYNPKWVRKSIHGHRTHENDQAVTMLWSLAIAIVIFFLLGLLWYAFAGRC
jgi:di/tricarboxylate transporter